MKISRFYDFTISRFYLLFVLLLPVSASAQEPLQLSRGLEIFADVYRQLDLFYVDTLSADTALRWAINGMLDDLDPYTVYYPDDNQEDLRAMATGKYGGIGAVIRASKKAGRSVVEEPYEGCPAQEAGVRAGDIILSIDGKDTRGWDNARVSKALRGEPGTTFELRVQRPNCVQPLSFRITRRQIQTPSVPWYGIIDTVAHTGYLYLSSITENCARDVKNAFIEMRQKGMQRFLLDLRDNGGGSVAEAVEIVGMFVPKGSHVVSTKGKVPATCNDYRTPDEPIDTIMPLAVLVNGGSASAAEIVSGALQDLDRAIIIGQRTYGKGIVQAIRDVPYRGQLKITTSRYYLPSGRCIQSYDYRHGGRKTSSAVGDSLKHVFHTRLGRIVRDDGGIMPDSVLAVDSMPTLVYDLMASDALFDYVNNYAATHDTIAKPDDFVLTDAEYAIFADSIAVSDFKYNARTKAALEQLRQIMSIEGRLSQAQAELQALEDKLASTDTRADILSAKKFIQPLLETEIISRYYYQRGAMQHHAFRDKDVRRALKMF